MIHQGSGAFYYSNVHLLLGEKRPHAFDVSIVNTYQGSCDLYKRGERENTRSCLNVHMLCAYVNSLAYQPPPPLLLVPKILDDSVDVVVIQYIFNLLCFSVDDGS